MPGRGGQGAERLRAVLRDLDTLHLGAPSGIGAALPAMREVIGLESLAVYGLDFDGAEWTLTRLEQVGLPARIQSLFRTMLKHGCTMPVFYDPRRVAPTERGRVVEARSWIDSKNRGAWERSAMCTQVFRPLNLHEHDQLRALICDGPALLAWFGGLHPEPVTKRQRAAMASLLPAMHRRLLTERRLAHSAIDQAALEVALERLGAAAVIFDGRGGIEQANAAARELLAESGAEVRTALADARAGRANRLQFDLTRLVTGGVGEHWLAIMQANTIETRIDACVRVCAARWELTARQADVLGLVARGHANATIATILGIGDRAIELHVTAIFDRAAVDSRAALVSRVLTIDAS